MMAIDDAFVVRLLLLSCVLNLGLWGTRRVIVAWLVYVSLRWHRDWQRPRVRRWLWLRTLAYADGAGSRATT